jgi:hypothetical protein
MVPTAMLSSFFICLCITGHVVGGSRVSGVELSAECGAMRGDDKASHDKEML